MAQPTFALLTCALHEHTYIGAFLSHYKNLGFQAFYILCDKFQPKYEPYLLGLENVKVTFIQMNYSKNDKRSFDKIQNIYYHKVVENIPYDWILLCDIDEFLYLPSSSILHYIKPLLIQYPQLAQVSFPWMMVDSLKENDYIHMFDELKEHKWFGNSHVKSIFQKKKLQYLPRRLPITSHSAHVNGFTYREKDYHSESAFMIHFHTRSFKNNIIKILTNNYIGKSDQSQKSKLLTIIKNDIYHYQELTKFSLIQAHQKGEIAHFPLTHLNHNILPNQIEYNNQLFNQLLEYYNLPKSYFEKIWINPEITIEPTSTIYIQKEENKIEEN